MKIAMLNARLVLLALAVLFFSLGSVWAQTVPVPSTNLSGTISVTNTFQQIQALNTNRVGCTIQNGATVPSGDLMWVYFGTCASATKAASIQLQPLQSTNCSLLSGSIVLSDAVCIAGSSGDSFFADFQ